MAKEAGFFVGEENMTAAMNAPSEHSEATDLQREFYLNKAGKNAYLSCNGEKLFSCPALVR